MEAKLWSDIVLEFSSSGDITMHPKCGGANLLNILNFYSFRALVLEAAYFKFTTTESKYSCLGRH
jgi:hypothetical protein